MTNAHNQQPVAARLNQQFYELKDFEAVSVTGRGGP
jgi:hypothetical protein